MTDRVTRVHRAAKVGVVGILAYLGIGAWTVLNILEADWVMAGIGAACVFVGVPKLISTVRRMRRQERRPAPSARRSTE